MYRDLHDDASTQLTKNKLLLTASDRPNMVSGAGAGAAMGVPRQSFEIDDSQEINNKTPRRIR